ncbi:hypothetical protein TNCV_657121 [Trichonephila clavipes]|nr:hypothetical protein TNCV_657121 [Trichonephila clavipes]
MVEPQSLTHQKCSGHFSKGSSMPIRGNRDVYLMTPRTITLGDGPGKRYRIHTGNVYSPQCCQMQMPSSCCCKKHLDSPEKTTSKHYCLWASSVIQFLLGYEHFAYK